MRVNAAEKFTMIVISTRLVFTLLCHNFDANTKNNSGASNNFLGFKRNSVVLGTRNSVSINNFYIKSCVNLKRKQYKDG